MFCRTGILAALLTAAPLIAAQSSPQQTQQPPTTTAAASLTGTHWTLNRLNGEAVTPESGKPAPYVELDAATNRLSGSGGCNRLLGAYEQNGPSLRFKQVASTMMACPGDAMKHEQAFIQALDTVTSYRIRGSTLTLRDKDKAEVARFKAQAAEATP